MKVGQIPDLSGPELPRHLPGTSGANGADRPVQGVTETDRVELSPASRLGQSQSPDGDVRAEKVAEVKNAIARGDFKIDISAVAERMIHEAASLVEMISAFESLTGEPPKDQVNNQEKFGAGPATRRTQGPDR
ncbi:MAG: flagellar biosynthesis anti-sigma factor FlgM [Burkholderiaceae bacterium]